MALTPEAMDELARAAGVAVTELPDETTELYERVKMCGCRLGHTMPPAWVAALVAAMTTNKNGPVKQSEPLKSNADKVNWDLLPTGQTVEAVFKGRKYKGHYLGGAGPTQKDRVKVKLDGDSGDFRLVPKKDVMVPVDENIEELVA